MALPAEPHSDPDSANHPDPTDFKFNSEMESLPIPPLDPEFFSSDNGMASAAVPSDEFMSDLGFGFGPDDNCDFELTFDDLDKFYLPSVTEDFLLPDGLDPGAAESNSGSPESGSSEISVSGNDKGGLDVSRFLNYPASSNECSENAGGPASSQGSGISEAVDSHSGNSGNSVTISSNAICSSDDEKVKVEDEMAKNYLVKRKKDSDEGNVESRSAKYRRSDNNNNSASVNVNVGANANDEEERRKARLMRNRESAQLSRQRKKHYVDELEDKVRAMHSTIADLNNRISYVMAENATLKQQLSSGGAMCPPPPPPPQLGMHPHPPMPPMAYPWMPYSPYVTKPQGSQSLLLPIPRLKSQQPAAAPKCKKSESKKSEGRTKKVASISFLGLLFFILLFGGLVPMVNVNFSGVMDRGFGGSSYVRDRFNGQKRGRLLNVHGHLNGSEEIISSGISGGKFDVFNKILHERGHHTRNMPKERPVPGSDEFARLHNTSSEPLVASLYVPRNDKLVKIDGNLIIHSVLASEKAMASHEPFERQNSRETGLAVAKDLVSALAIPKPGGNRGIRAPLYRNSAGPHKALTSGSTDVPKDRMKSTSADGKLQQWFREGLAGPMLSSGMCTEVFQFDVSAAASSGGIIPASSVSNVSERRQNTTEPNRGRKRRILRGLPIPLAGSGHNVTEENVKGNQQNNTLPGNRSVSPMVVSVLVDPREAGDIDVDGMIKPNSLSRIFVVVLLDSVKYVTYSCVLPRSGPHLVTT